MTLTSYIAGAATLIAGIFIVLQPPSPSSDPHPTSSWWESLSNWVFHSHPPPSYSNLPLFGIAPDVRIRPVHSIKGLGFHRRYRVDVELTKEGKIGLEDCNLVAEWYVAKDFIVDQWLLHKSSKVHWEFGTVIDLEAPAYSDRAQPFNLKATLPLGGSSRASIEIPDIVPRYQQPSILHDYSPKTFIHPPKLRLDCPSGDGMGLVSRVEGNARFKPLDIQVSVGFPSENINCITYSTIALCLLYLLFHLYRA